jgi:nucleoside-diphosphate-sugar epimerase
VDRTIVVTGGSGFLGSKVADRLRKEGFTVYQMALPNEDVEGEWFFKGDITDPGKFEFPPAGTVVHCAGILESSHPTDELMFKVNHEGTMNVYNEGIRKGMKRMVFISTVAAIGPQGTTEKGMTEDMVPAPKDAYGRSKLKAEQYITKKGMEDGLDVIILRPTVLYGEGMNIHSSGMKTFSSIDKGIMPMVGGGRTIYNLLHVDNFIDAIVLSVMKGSGTVTYHVSEGPYTHKEVVGKIEERLGKKGHRNIPKCILYILARSFETLSPLMKGPPIISMTKYRGLTTSIWHLDYSRIRKELGYEPTVSLAEGVDRTISSYGLGNGENDQRE